MPTINQLVRQGRTSSVKKSNAPALGKNMNTLKKSLTNVNSPQKRGVCGGCLWGAALVPFFLCAIYFALTRWILARRLNLE